jgi:hypothetical protein
LFHKYWKSLSLSSGLTQLIHINLITILHPKAFNWRLLEIE